MDMDTSLSVQQMVHARMDSPGAPCSSFYRTLLVGWPAARRQDLAFVWDSRYHQNRRRSSSGKPSISLYHRRAYLLGSNRITKREEGSAYSLFGIFDIHMPLIYGEGRKNALIRLQRGIENACTDDTLLTPFKPAYFRNPPSKQRSSSAVATTSDMHLTLLRSTYFEDVWSRWQGVEDSAVVVAKNLPYPVSGTSGIPTATAPNNSQPSNPSAVSKAKPLIESC
jgi:hypothetical protein